MQQQAVMCWGRRHEDDDADRKRNGKGENDDVENTKKLVQDLVAAVNGFGVSRVIRFIPSSELVAPL